MIDIVGFLISWLTLLGIYSILALTLNFESGVSGVTNFGKVLFYGIGAYAAAATSTYLLLALNGIDPFETPPYDIKGIIALGQLSTRNPAVNLGIFLLTIILAFLVAGALGYMLSYPILRVGPAFVGFTLLSSGELARIFLQHYTPLGASKGLMAIPGPFAWIPDPRLRDALFLVVALLLLSLTYIVLHRLVNSPLGRTLRAMRDDEVAALCLGKHVPRMKAAVLFIGSGFSGVAGALLAYYLTAVNPDMFVPAVTFNVWAMIILGGLGNLKGSLAGAAIFTLFDRLLTFLTPHIGITAVSPDYIRWFTVGLLIVVLLIARPQGLLPEEVPRTPALEELRRVRGESGA